MLRDLNVAGDDPFEGVYDLCVAGSGPAGMTVAREAAARGLRVALLEAGGRELSAESQSVCEAKSIGPLTYYGVETCRLRMLGGSSGHWAGRCAILDEIDFSARDIWGLPGWPISRAETYARLDDAKSILDIEDQSLAPRAEPHWRQGRFVTSGFARSAPTRFGEKYLGELIASPKIDLVLNANMLGLDLSEARDGVDRATVGDYRGRRFKIAAKTFVVAFGALENARFLLNAAADTGAPIGDAGGFVGRCFMEHFEVTLGRFIASGGPLWRRDGALSLSPAPSLAERRRLGSAVVTLSPSAQARYFGRLAPLRAFANDVLCGVDHATSRGGVSNNFRVCAGEGVVTNIIEQVPSRDSRVVLDRQGRDRFGNPRLAVDWRYAPQDLATIKALAEEVGKAIAEQNAGRFQIAPGVREGAPETGFHCHQMGTTRMSADPKFGVVDGDCRVHGMRNLYVAGSSVFPTGGGVNPTTTIVALALRLGAHLAGAVRR